MKVKHLGFDILQKDTLTILKSYKIPLILISFLTGVLVFIMNLFLASALYGQQFNDQLKNKLGVYIYLKDNTTEETANTIKSDLERNWLLIKYSSKQQSLEFVEKRISDLTTTLRKYNLENPLPATLYITYQNFEQFQTMKSTLETHKDHIINMNDLSDNTIKTQEKRVLNIINLSNFIQSIGYGIVTTMIIVIVSFALFFLKSIFAHFKLDIQAKKLLGASASQIAQPFLRVIFIALGCGFIIAGGLLVTTIFPLQSYLLTLFNFNLRDYLLNGAGILLAIGIIEIGALMLVLMGISYWYVLRLHKKLR